MLEFEKAYLPAAGHDWLLPLYDPLVKLLGGLFLFEAIRQHSEGSRSKRTIPYSKL